MRGLPDQVSLRSISTGTTTRQPSSARRRANCASLPSPGASPASCSGAQSASGIATTFITARSFGSSRRPSPSTLPQPDPQKSTPQAASGESWQAPSAERTNQGKHKGTRRHKTVARNFPTDPCPSLLLLVPRGVDGSVDDFRSVKTCRAGDDL